MPTEYRITYADGLRPDTASSMEEALGIIARNTGNDSDDLITSDDHGDSRVLVWDDEELAENDPGVYAIAAIQS